MVALEKSSLSNKIFIKDNNLIAADKITVSTIILLVEIYLKLRGQQVQSLITKNERKLDDGYKTVCCLDFSLEKQVVGFVLLN